MFFGAPSVVLLSMTYAPPGSCVGTLAHTRAAGEGPGASKDLQKYIRPEDVSSHSRGFSAIIWRLSKGESGDSELGTTVS